jgi:hypothetical protein
MVEGGDPSHMMEEYKQEVERLKKEVTQVQ